MKDLFECYNTLPMSVQEVLHKHSEMDNDYQNCEDLIKELNEVGYTCDYGLDGIPYELKKNNLK